MVEWDTPEYRGREQASLGALLARHPRSRGVNVRWLGWHDLVDEIVTDFERLLPAGHELIFLDAAEKWGGIRLRWRIEPQLPAVAERDFYDAAYRDDGPVQRSFRTCQVCGEPGDMRRSGPAGWVTIRCDEHSEGAPRWRPGTTGRRRTDDD